MFASMLNKHTRFEKFISTLIVIAMSASFLLSGIPSGGGVRPNSGIEKAEAAGQTPSEVPKAGLPATDGPVTAVATAPDGTTYISGNFSTVGGQPRTRLAAIDSSGNLTSWNPGAGWYVNSFAFSSSTMYISGPFTSVDGQTRNRLAAFDLTTGNLTSWNPDANDVVHSIVESNGVVYVAGEFTTINGQSRSRIAAIDPSGSGTVLPWNPGAAGGRVTELLEDNSILYASGIFSSMDGQTRNGLAAFDLTTGNLTSWDPNADGNVDEMVINDGLVYVGGNFTTVGGQTRTRLAALELSTGNAAPWNPTTTGGVIALAVKDSIIYVGGGFSSASGQSRNNLAAFDLSGNLLSWNPNADNAVYDLHVNGSTLYAGGSFANIGGQPNANFAAFDFPPPPPDTMPPTLVNSTPTNDATGVPVTIRQIDLTFSEPIVSADATAFGTKLKFKKQDGIDHTTRFANFSNVSGNDYKIDLVNADLMPDTTYIVEISGFQDAAGNTISPTTVTFTTGSGSPPPSDTTGPSTFIGTPAAPYQPVSGPNVDIGAQIDDTFSGNSAIAAAEYFITPSGGVPSADGTGIPLSAGDGTFDSPWEGAFATWDSTSVPNGINIIHVHGKDASGNWGEFATVPVDVQNGALQPETHLEAMINHNWINGSGFAANSQLSVLVNGGAKAIINSVTTDEIGNFWINGSDYNFQIAPLDTIDVSDGINTANMVVKDLAAQVDVDTNVISGFAFGYGYTPLEGSLVRINITEYFGAPGEPLHSAQTYVQPDGSFTFNLSSFDLLKGQAIFLTVNDASDGSGHQTHIAPYNSDPLLDANITQNWVGGSGFPENESVSISIANSLGVNKGFFNSQTDGGGNFWLNGWENGIQVERGDAIDVFYSGGTVSMVVQKLDAMVDVDANTISGSAFDKFDVPLEGYTVGVQILNPNDDFELAFLETTVSANGSFMVDFGQVPFDLQKGQKIIIDLFGGGIGHSTLIEPNNSIPVLGAMIDHNWIDGWNLPPNENVNVKINDGNKANFAITTDNFGNFWADGWQYWPNYQIESGDKIDVLHSGGIATMFVQNLNATADADANAISGTAATPDGTPLAGQNVDVSIQSDWGVEGDLAQGQAVVSADATFNIDLNPFDLVLEQKIFLTVTDSNGNQTHIAPYNSLPDLISPQVLQITPEGSKVGVSAWLGATGTDNIGWDKVVFEYTTDNPVSPDAVWNYIGQNDEPWLSEWRWDEGTGQWIFDPENAVWGGSVSWDTSSLPEGNYTVRARAYDYFGNSGYLTKEYYLDKTPPEAPANLIATPGEGYIDLNWNPSTSNDTAYYNIYKSSEPGAGEFGGFVGSVDATTNYRSVVSSDAAYYYVVKAVDDAENQSGPSNEASAIAIADVTPPQVLEIIPDGSKIGIYAWVGAMGTDDNVWQSVLFQYTTDGGLTWNDIGTANWPWFEEIWEPVGPNGELVNVVDLWGGSVSWDTSSLPEGNYTVRARAYDYFGNFDDLTKEYFLDKTAPEAPANLTASAGQGYVDLDWDPSASQDTAFYEIYKSSEPGAGQFGWYVASVDALSTYYKDIVSSDATYFYTVKAVDDAGNQSGSSNEASTSPEAGGETATVSGKVLSGGQGVSGATIYAYPDWGTTGGKYFPPVDPVTTDPNGNFTIELPVNNEGVKYFFSASGYDESSNWFWTPEKLTPALNADDIITDFNLSSTGVNPPTIVKPDYGITVFNKDVSVEGSAIPGATVNITVNGYDSNWNTLTNTYHPIANLSGNFTQMIEAYKGYNNLYVTQTIDGVTSSETYWYFYGQLVDNPTTISGIVTSASESPIGGASVYIWGDSFSNYYSNTAATLEDGSYTFTVPAGASYGVYAYRYVENYGWQYTNTTNIFAKTSGQTYPANLEFNLIPPVVNSPTTYETVTTSTVNVTGVAEAGATVYISQQGYDQNWKWVSYQASQFTETGDFSISLGPLQGYNYLYVTQSLNGKTSDTYSTYFYADIVNKATVSGQVTKYDGTTPVENATIYIGETSGWQSYSATTDIDGNYSISLPSDKSYYAYAYGYINGQYAQTDIQSFTVGNDPVNFKFPLEAPTIDQPANGQSLSATPITVSGTGSPGATVTISYYGYDQNWWYLGQNQTTAAVAVSPDANGNYNYQAPITPFDGHNYIYAYQTTESGDVSQTTYSYFTDDIPDGKVTISGSVYQADGNAVEGATVYLWSDTGWNNYSATTASDGTYSIIVPSNVSYSGYAYKYNNYYYTYSDVKSLGVISVDTTADFSFKPAPPVISNPGWGATLTNKAVTVEGASIVGAEISIVASHWNSKTWQYEETTYPATPESDGSFSTTIDVPSDGDYYLYVYQTINGSKSDAAVSYFYVDSTATTYNVSGKAVKADGSTAVEGATIYIYGNKASGSYFSTQTTTKSDGTYSMDLPANGSYTIYGYKYDSTSVTYKYTDYKYTGTLTSNQTNVNLMFSPEAPTITKVGTSSDANKYNSSIGATTPKVDTSPVILSGTGAAPSWKVYVYSYGYDEFGYYQYNYYETTANSDGTFTVNNFKVFNDKNEISIYQYKPDYSQYSETGYTYFYGDGIATTASTATIKGKVTDASTGNPIQGATVYIDNYTKRYEATTAFDGTYTKDVPAASYSTYYTAYASKDSSDYMPSASQTTWVSSGGIYTFDFTLGKVTSDNGILTAQSKNKQGKIDYRMVFGASPAIANVDSSSSSFGLEVATGSDEYWATLSDGSSAPGIWRMYNSDGTLKWNTSTKNDEARTSVAIVDIDGDGKLEIIGGTTSGNSVEVIDDADTSNPNVAQFLTGGFVHASPAVADVDPNTAGLEIAAASYSGKVFLLKYNGTDKTISELWNYKIADGWNTMASSPAIGDLDGDGKKEIVVGSSDGYIYALNKDGTLKWKYQTGGEINSSPALANIDGVAGREVIVGSNDGKVYAISTSTSSSGASNANLLWSYKTGASVYSSPSVADINNDGKYEIVVGSNDGYVYALKTDGKLVWSKDTGSAVYSSPAIANRTSSSVAIYIGNDNGQLLMLNGNDGTLIDKFNTQAMIRTSPVVADIDGDGKLEIAVNDWRSGGDMTWVLKDKESSVSSYANEWPMFGYDSARRATKEIADTKIAPAAPSITSHSTSSTNYSSSTSQTISGSTASETTVELFDGTTSKGSANVAVTDWALGLNNLWEGTHNITAKATKGMLISEASKAAKIVIDTTKPAITITGVAQSQSYSSGVKATFSASDATPTTVSAKLDGSDYTSGTAITTGGWHTLVITATDSANNTQTKTIAFEVTVDKVAPSITFVSPTPENNSAVYSGTQTIKAKITDSGSDVNASTVVIKDNDTDKTSSATFDTEMLQLNLSGMSTGLHTITVTAKDNALTPNEATAITKFYYKATQPSLSITPTISISPGDAITLSGTNFIGSDIVKITRVKADGTDEYIGSATADNTGAFTYNYTTPAKISAGTRTFKAVGSYNIGASATVDVKLDFYPDSGTSFKQSDNPTIYVNGGEAAKSITLTYKTEPDNGANPVSIAPVTKETDTTWYYGKWTTNIVPKGSYKITATAKDAGGNTLGTSTAIYSVTEKDLTLSLVPQSGSNIEKNSTLTAIGSLDDVTSVTFEYSVDGGNNYTSIASIEDGTSPEVGKKTIEGTNSFFDVFFNVDIADGPVKIKAYPNGDSSKAVYADYTLVSDASLTLYPEDGSTINDNPTLAAKVTGTVSKVTFQRYDSESGWVDIDVDTSIDSASWFETTLFDTTNISDGESVKVRAFPDDDTSKAQEATYTMDKDLSLNLVTPDDNSTVEDNPYIWLEAGDGVTSVKTYISTDEGLTYTDASTVDENITNTIGNSFYHYPNTNQWFYQLYTDDLDPSTEFKVKLVPNDEPVDNAPDAIYAIYTTQAEGNLGIQLYPEDGSTLKKKPTLTVKGDVNSINSVEFFYSYYDSEEDDWSDNIPLMSKDGKNSVTQDSDELFRLVEADTSDIDEGELKITAVSYNSDKSDSDSVTNTYTLDKTAPKKPSNIQVTYSPQKGVEVHWTDPQNQADDRAGYNVYRRTQSTSYADTPIAFVQYDGTDSSFFYNDWETTTAGTYYYNVRTVDLAGNESAYFKEKSITIVDGNKPHNQGNSQNVNPAGKGNGQQSSKVLAKVSGVVDDGAKELSAVGNSTDTDAFDLAVDGSDVSDSSVVSLNPINDESADTYDEKKILDDINGLITEKNNEYNGDGDLYILGGTIFEAGSKTIQSGKVVSKLNSSSSESGAQMEISYDPASVPDGYYADLRYYDGGKIKRVSGQNKSGGKISGRVRHFSSYFVVFVKEPVAKISGVTAYNYYKTITPAITTDGDVTMTYKLNGTNYTPGTAINTEGKKVLVVTATDKSDTSLKATKTVTFYIDKTGPTTTFKSTTKAANSHVKGTISIYASAIDPKLSGVTTAGSGVKDVKLSDDGSTYKQTDATYPYTFTVKTTNYKNGKHTFKILSTDKAGNTKYTTRVFYIDNAKPTIPSAYVSPSAPSKGTSAKLYYKVSDTVSPKVNVTVQIRTTGGAVKSSAIIGAVAKGKLLYKGLKMPVTAGTYVYRVIATDYATNQLIKDVKFSVK